MPPTPFLPAQSLRRADSAAATTAPAPRQATTRKATAAGPGTAARPRPAAEPAFDWNNPWVVGIATGIVAGLLGGIILFLFQRKLTSWLDQRQAARRAAEAARRKKAASSAIYQDFGPLALADAQQHFQAHALQRPSDENAADWQPLPAGQTSLAYFLEEFLGANQPEQQLYLVVGPTGIGKTTFLLNLYAQYAAQTQHRDAPDLLLGPLGSGYDNFRQRHLLPRLAENGGSHDTILLLDALDEYRYRHTAGGAGSASQAFEEEFSRFWVDFQEHIAPRFRKVVITVREQFFQTWDEQNVQVGQQAVAKLRLSPFDEEARKHYLAARYPRAAAKAKHDGLLYLNSRLTLLGHTFLEIPLLLTYLEYVWEAQQAQLKASHYREETFLTGHNLVDVLVNRWLQREGTSKKLVPARLGEFCQRLAYALVEAGPYAALPVAKLEELENKELGSSKSVLAAFGGRGDRSLLVRKGSLNTDDFRFEFVHERFLGYFLALYAEASPENAARVPFDKHPYGLRYFIGKRWRERLKAPLPAYQKPETGNNVVPLPVLRAWGEVLDGLVGDCNEATQVAFRESWEEILEKEVPDWRESFQAMSALTITAANLGQLEDAAARVGLSYFRNFVTHIELRYETLVDGRLSPLAGAQNISWLDLRDTKLAAQQLTIFARSAKQLLNLGLDGIDLSATSPAWFAQTERLVVLSLGHTALPVEQLIVFERNAKHLLILWLLGIDLSTSAPAWFAQTEQLKTLILNNTYLPAAKLDVFKRSAKHLQKLGLVNIDLSVDSPDWFAQTEQLTDLALGNTRLPAARLAVFERQAKQLVVLMLDGIDLGADSPAWFAQTRRLSELSLINTNLSGYVLGQFKYSALTINELRISGNPAITEDAFACFHEHQERLMKLAENHAWSRTGPNLPHPDLYERANSGRKPSRFKYRG